jgi:hypothetical protein
VYYNNNPLGLLKLEQQQPSIQHPTGATDGSVFGFSKTHLVSWGGLFARVMTIMMLLSLHSLLYDWTGECEWF